MRLETCLYLIPATTLGSAAAYGWQHSGATGALAAVGMTSIAGLLLAMLISRLLRL